MINRVDWDDNESIEALRAVLNNKKVILGVSDTVLGLLASVTPDGFEALNTIKGRQNKPYLVVLKDVEEVRKWVSPAFFERYRPLMEACWPGPLTLIVPAHCTVPSYACSPERNIAIRVPNHVGLLALLADLDDGLFSTSANKAGDPVPESLGEVHPDLLTQVACVVEQKTGKSQIVPSTILDCTGDQVRVVRQGAYPIENLEDLLGSTFLY